MRFRLALRALVLLVSAQAAAQTTTTTGTFTLADADNVLGRGTSVSLNASNASYAATATFDTTTPTQIDAVHFAASPTGSGGIFTLDFENGTSAIGTGTFTVDGTTANATLSFANGTSSADCRAAFGTVTISALTTNPAATTTSVFTNLQGSFDFSCSNVSSSVTGTFGLTSSTTPGSPTPPPPSGGSNSGDVPAPRFGPPFVGRQPTTPATPATPPAPTLTVSGPVQTLLGPINLATGDTATLQFTTVTNSSFDAPVALSATSDQPGLTFAFSPATIAAPGNGTSNIAIGTSGAVPGNFLVTVVASGGGLTATTTFALDVFCDPPQILGVSQPANTTIANGATAQLSVAPLGSGPFTYQWYEGYQGFTSSPVDGGTSATLTTPPLNSTTQFWVRVWNACGSVDSNTVTVSVKP